MPTIGVAIAIPEPWASELQDYRTSIGDVTAAQIPTHITLLPPMEVTEAEVDVMSSHLAATASSVAPFSIHLRGTSTFRPVSPVVFVTVIQGISSCEQLADALRRGPLAVDLDFPYHPHVTVAHHLDDTALDRAFDDLASFECSFDVDSFCLYVHGDSQGWRPTREFTLTAHTP